MKSINSALHGIIESMEKSAPQDHGIILEKEKPHKRSCAFKFPSLPTKKKIRRRKKILPVAELVLARKITNIMRKSMC